MLASYFLFFTPDFYLLCFEDLFELLKYCPQCFLIRCLLYIFVDCLIKKEKLIFIQIEIYFYFQKYHLIEFLSIKILDYDSHFILISYYYRLIKSKIKVHLTFLKQKFNFEKLLIVQNNFLIIYFSFNFYLFYNNFQINLAFLFKLVYFFIFFIQKKVHFNLHPLLRII